MISKTEPIDFKPKNEVVSCFCENDGKFLILQRNGDKSAGNKWGLPAGKLEFNETLPQAIARELVEEASLLADELDLLYHGKFFVEHYGYQIIFHVFRGTVGDTKTVKINPGEHQDCLWVSPEESLELDLVDGQDYVIKDLYQLV